MTMKELMKKSRDELEELSKYMVLHDNLGAVTAINYVIKFANKHVRVVKGRKVPKGTEGVIFWMGSYCNSPYGDPWGIYTTYRCGLKDDNGRIYWTALSNVELVQKPFIMNRKKVNIVKNTIKLHGIYGEKQGIPTKDLQIGDIIMWNWGYKSEVVEILPSKTGKTITFMLKSLQDGNIRPRRMSADRLVVKHNL